MAGLPNISDATLTKIADNCSKLKMLGATFSALDLRFRNKDLLPMKDADQMKLYGLSKQVSEGTCRMPRPPSSNIILSCKWDSWTSCANLSREEAMTQFVALAQKILEDAEASATSTPTPAPSSSATPPKALAAPRVASQQRRKSTDSQPTVDPSAKTSQVSTDITKQGTLYKQRDWSKGWRAR